MTRMSFTVGLPIRRGVAALLLAMLLIPMRALAWGEAGHRIIARIAEGSLTPEAGREIRKLLGGSSLADVANWADSIRPSRGCTAPWHYIDIPLGDPSSLDPMRDCIPCSGAGRSSDSLGCVVAAIARFHAELADTSLPRASRAEALKFLAHLVGDLHQPLHAADNHDRGGNEVIVTFHGQRLNPYGRGDRPWNLHAVWDAGMIDRALARSAEGDEVSYARLLRTRALAGDPARIEAGTPIDWALESHAIADSVVYRHLPPGHPADIGDEYEHDVLPSLEGSLARAGIRLAAMLNELFR